MTTTYRIYSLIIFLINQLVSFSTASQTPEVIWKETFTGIGVEKVIGVQQSTNGFYYCGISTDSDQYIPSNSSGPNSVKIIQLNKNRDVVWEKKFGGNGFSYYLTSIKLTRDGGIICFGVTYNTSVTNYKGNGDYWASKIDSLGNVLWEKAYGTYDYENSREIIQTTDDGFILVGRSDYKSYILKINPLGQVIWESLFYDSTQEETMSVVELSDKTIVAAGYFYERYNGKQIYVTKLSSGGNRIWRKTFGTTNDDVPFHIITSSQNELVLTGIFNDNILTPEINAVLFLRLDFNGNKKQEKSLIVSYFGDALTIQETTLGEFIILGSVSPTTTRNHLIKNIWIAKLNPQGDIIWDKVLSEYGGQQPESLFLTKDNGIIVSGYVRFEEVLNGNTRYNVDGVIYKLLTCPDNYNINSINSQGLFQASESIQSNALIPSKTIFSAGKYILLKPGFSSNNQIFKAEINICEF